MKRCNRRGGLLRSGTEKLSPGPVRCGRLFQEESHAEKRHFGGGSGRYVDTACGIVATAGGICDCAVPIGIGVGCRVNECTYTGISGESVSCLSANMVREIIERSHDVVCAFSTTQSRIELPCLRAPSIPSYVYVRSSPWSVMISQRTPHWSLVGVPAVSSFHCA
jgi:hypothetical protein